MPAIQFRVDGIPKAQPRVKAFRRGSHAGVYDPGTADYWKLQVIQAAKQGCLASKIEGPIGLGLTFVMPRPKSHFKPDGSIRPKFIAYHIKKPDVDNLAKAVMDALSNLGSIWSDDCQVCLLTVSKCYHQVGVNPGCNVRIDSL